MKKRFLAFSVCMAVLLASFTGCYSAQKDGPSMPSSSQTVQSGSGSSAEEPVEIKTYPLPEENVRANIIYVPSPSTGGFWTCAVFNAKTIQAYDPTTKTAYFPCYQAGCKHNDASCTANFGGVISGLAEYRGNFYAMVYYNNETASAFVTRPVSGGPLQILASWEPENENQMLAVWGSPGSGKTTTAVKLAARLAMQKKDVALLLCDMNTPMLPCICPPGDLEEEHSLGSVLAATHVSESLVRHNCITHKKIRHLTILGMRKGENEYTYPPYERPQAEELLQCLRKIAPYIIVDCGSCIANDILSAIALMEADAVLRLVNCDLKSISYLSSQLPLLKDSQWDAEKQYKVASNVYPNEASEHIERVLGNVAFQIPHSEEVKAQVLEGNLLKELVLKDSKGFRKTMEAITKEVFGC